MRRIAKSVKKAECIGYYEIVRTSKTDVEWMVNIETVEEFKGTWSEFVAYAKSKYIVRETNKRGGVIKVA